MAQSKKDLLKRLQRRCLAAGRACAYTAYTAGDIALLDTYSQLRLDIQEARERLHCPRSADLEQVSFPMTCQHVDHLRMRMVTLQQRLIPSPHLPSSL